MDSKTLDYYASEIGNYESLKKKENKWMNKLLDDLNARDCRLLSPLESKKISFILNQCCSLILPSETFLVAKCCQLMLTVVGRQAIQPEKSLLSIAVPWCLQALQESADIALLDILQALEAIIRLCPKDLSEMAGDIIESLRTPLESKVSLTAPLDVRVWRIQCLCALAPIVSDSSSVRPSSYLSLLYDLLEKRPNLECDADAQVVRFVLEAMGTLCQTDTVWLNENVGEVLGVAVTFIHFGLEGWRHQTPTRLFPLPGAMTDTPKAPNVKSKIKRKQKKRVSNIAGTTDGDEDPEDGPKPSRPSYMMAPACVTWLTSDSEVSDSEGGRTRRVKRTQARVRLVAINIIIHVAKTVNVRDLFGFYCSLMGSQGLSHSLINDPNPRVTVAAASTLSFLLGNAKSYLAQAQHSTVKTYTPFSAVLAALLTNLHHSVVTALISPAPLAVLHCAACLVDVTPYHRLGSDILPPLLQAVLPYLRHKDVSVVVAAVTVLGVVVSLQPHTDQLTTLLSSTTPPISLPELPEDPPRSWVLAASLNYLQGDNERAVMGALRVEWWQVLGALMRHHYPLVQHDVPHITTAMARDMRANIELVKLHAARAFHILAEIMAGPDADVTECVEVWNMMIGSQLLSLLGSSPGLTTTVCECLGAMSPSAYQHLTEKQQICCITSLLGCARDEEPNVRAAAVQALANYLTFPTLSQDEQFVSDCSEVICHLIKDPFPLVSGKASWALGNLSDMLYKTQLKEEIIPPIQLIRTSFTAAQDRVKVRANGMRALGNLLGLLKEKHFSKPEYKEVLVQAAQILAKNATSNLSMKVSWNACYALGSMLKNEAIHDASSEWQDIVLPALCTVLTRSSNFKVRMNACVALSCVQSRSRYGAHYLVVWRALLAGLDNAFNMTDFKEVKHQDSLLEQLCLAMCHLTSVVELSDLSQLHEVVVYHCDTMQQHLSRFNSSTVPERTEAVLHAASRVATLRETSQLTVTQRDALTILTSVFTFDV
ncbi:HEAT repeat-containing protein 6-like [Macrosteles quadrilineatus]|uniref:HEAT repeat-containing protein 6-like n=1 Tax=Macrosteles quadrilineatus TaxID=74068 RepID=UPI0023E1CC1E|nr:HEAT repeat-containing protein 6-like [Macrosteles quadrilineatus]